MNPKFHARVACIWEAAARKVGNVHPGAGFVDAELASFLVSAVAIRWAAPREADGGRVGGMVIQALQDTRRAVGTNTNLGIILLLAPLIAVHARADLRAGVVYQLRRSTVRDTRLVYEAIRLANPGGLGRVSEHDVRDEPTLPLVEAMKRAADRDLVARQYANGFADVFDFGVPAFLDALGRFGRVEAAVIDCQFRWLAEFPDSLIARKNGPAVAADVRKRAGDILKLGGIATPEGRAAAVVFDKRLRGHGNKLNPGTTADLVTACLFVALRENKVAPSAPFRWDVPDWL